MTTLVLNVSLPSGAFDSLANGPIANTAPHSEPDHISSKLAIDPSRDTSSPGGQLASLVAPISCLAHELAMQSPLLNSASSVNHVTTDFLTSRPLVQGGDLTDTSSGCFHPNITSLSPPAPWDMGTASIERSVSADSVNASHSFYSGLNGNSSLGDRSNLDALRRRAERLCRDQQTVFDEMSDQWVKEKAELLQLVHLLRERLHLLENENTVLRSAGAHKSRTHDSEHQKFSSQRRSLVGMYDKKSSLPHGPCGYNASETSGGFSLPPGLDGASRRPHFAKPTASPCRSPSGAPTVGHIGSLSPRTEPQNSASTDFLLPSPSLEHAGDVPIIDVQEIDPKLEGIPIRATAVQRPTFEPTATCHQAIVKTCITKSDQEDPPASDSHQAKRKGLWGAWEREKLRNDRRRSGLAPLTIIKNPEQAKNLLAADESRRLTMHAGHTPNHSQSIFPTMTATEGSSAAARSHATASTAAPCSIQGEQDIHTIGDYVETDRAQQLDQCANNDLEKTQIDGISDADIEGLLESADDVPLKGPLMIKNIPAQDEIFWARVNQRLDPISQGKDALPRVLQSPMLDTTSALEDTSSTQQNDAHAPVESSAGMKSEDEVEDGSAAVETDVPLIFKATSNFGTPFGCAS
ncbi:hypothetical protein E4U40_001770 [Claviceps sp. LM458 group G5]|nr:hypothetical protein E4U40_001770 [Claviceps sp. LM458 group G5]